ncbi:unnamed protein product [Brassica oleracea var. botrytis]
MAEEEKPATTLHLNLLFLLRRNFHQTPMIRHRKRLLLRPNSILVE